MHPMLNIAIQAARSASKVSMRFIDQLSSIPIGKDRQNVFQEVTKVTEEEIRNTIQKSYPNQAILSKNSNTTSLKNNEETYWYVDAINGDQNYLHGFPQFATSIAMKRNDRVEIGVVFDPIRNELFTAVRGKGAQLNNQRIRVSQTKELHEALIGTAFPFREVHHLKPFLVVFENIFPKTAGIRRAGSSALDLAYVAAGRLDGYWQAAMPDYEIAAGLLFIQEAGGMIGDFDGQHHYWDSGNLVVGNAKIYKLLLENITHSLKSIRD